VMKAGWSWWILAATCSASSSRKRTTSAYSRRTLGPPHGLSDQALAHADSGAEYRGLMRHHVMALRCGEEQGELLFVGD
jgi:hypothetical protein